MPRAMLMAVGAAALIAGLWLLAAGSVWQARVSRISVRAWAIERRFYRHHRASGAAIVASALILIASLAIYGNEVFVFGTYVWPAAAKLLRLVEIAAWSGAVFTLAIGLVVVVRPSLLKPFEALANIWVEPVPMIPNQDHWSRAAGWSLLVTGLFCTLAAGGTVSLFV